MVAEFIEPFGIDVFSTSGQYILDQMIEALREERFGDYDRYLPAAAVAKSIIRTSIQSVNPRWFSADGSVICRHAQSGVPSQRHVQGRMTMRLPSAGPDRESILRQMRQSSGTTRGASDLTGGERWTPGGAGHLTRRGWTVLDYELFLEFFDRGNGICPVSRLRLQT